MDGQTACAVDAVDWHSQQQRARTDCMCSRCSGLALSAAEGTVRLHVQSMQWTGTLSSRGHGPIHARTTRYRRIGVPQAGNTVSCKARLNDWPPDTAWPTSCPAISEMNQQRSANRVNWDSAKTGPSKLDSSCQTLSCRCEPKFANFPKWKQFVLGRRDESDLHIYIDTNNYCKFMFKQHTWTNILIQWNKIYDKYLPPTYYNNPVPKHDADSGAITGRRWIFVTNCILLSTFVGWCIYYTGVLISP